MFTRRFRVWLRSAILALAAASALRVSATDDDAYRGEIEAARAARVQQLTKPDGWLTLVGLDFLKAGANSVGSAADNAIVIARAPAHVGTVMLGTDGRTAITLNPAAGARVDGAEVLSAGLESDLKGAPTMVSCGTINFYVIDRDGRKALRVKDSAAERRTKFAGLDYFPIDPSWRIEADWVAFERPKEVPIANVLGQVEPALVPGKAVFRRDGKTFELLPIIEGPDEPLFFVIADATSGKETYGASRFLYADLPRDGKVILDFNLARNPPCAFSPYATCPLPPKENRLPIAVTAGEKKYRGGGE
ncbi:MAG TPA: DUF1684 domain-containing protein [Opitutus sp.]|nr:DUF1684 domain-containing protein [Opitutus sp.]